MSDFRSLTRSASLELPDFVKMGTFTDQSSDWSTPNHQRPWKCRYHFRAFPFLFTFRLFYLSRSLEMSPLNQLAILSPLLLFWISIALSLPFQVPMQDQQRMPPWSVEIDPPNLHHNLHPNGPWPSLDPTTREYPIQDVVEVGTDSLPSAPTTSVLPDTKP